MSAIDHTHDPAAASWVASANGHPDFPVQNLPLGIFSTDGGVRRAGVAIGDMILDLAGVTDRFDPEWEEDLALPVLNAWLARGPDDHRALRHLLFAILIDPAEQDRLELALVRQSEATMHLPTIIGDYTDFYVGIHHATNVGRQFRPDQPLLPNYKYIPIGYHGRASSVRASGEQVVRPSGQRKAPHLDVP